MGAPQDQGSPPPTQKQALPGRGKNDTTGNLMYGPEGRTARLTLISVLLGAMVGTLVAVLPPTPAVFVTTVLTPGHLLIDLQVLAVLLLVFDLWIEFTWTGMLGVSPFDFLSNFQLFLTVLVALGWTLSVRDFRAWVVWSAGVAAMSLVNGLIWRVIRRVPVPWWRLALFLGATLSAVYVGCDLYGLLPSSLTLAIPPVLWAGVVIAEVAANLALFWVYLHGYGARFARPA